MIERGCIGINSRAVPALGVGGVAIWSITGSTSTKGIAPVVARLRRHFTWLTLVGHAVECRQLLLVDAPAWAVVSTWIMRKRRSLADPMSCNRVEAVGLRHLFDIAI